jgi:hypothetical protein
MRFPYCRPKPITFITQCAESRCRPCSSVEQNDSWGAFSQIAEAALFHFETKRFSFFAQNSFILSCSSRHFCRFPLGNCAILAQVDGQHFPNLSPSVWQDSEGCACNPLHKMKIILMFAPKHRACYSPRVAKHYPPRIVLFDHRTKAFQERFDHAFALSKITQRIE